MQETSSEDTSIPQPHAIVSLKRHTSERRPRQVEPLSVLTPVVQWLLVVVCSPSWPSSITPERIVPSLRLPVSPLAKVILGAIGSLSPWHMRVLVQINAGDGIFGCDV